MSGIKLTKGELKRQSDALRQYERYLPTLQLKKQQLQVEILQKNNILLQKKEEESKKMVAVARWSGLLAEEDVDLNLWAQPREVFIETRNIAGVDIPVFRRAEFSTAEYDLFLTPLWVDAAINFLRELTVLRAEIRVLREGLEVLKQELRITSQRVNLFEKVKIPEAKENIRLIKIYIGDQLANAVGRSKIAKHKIESAEEALV